MIETGACARLVTIQAMGTFEVAIEIGGPAGQRWETLRALVDRGSTYTWVPSSMLRRLGVSRQASWDFETADGRLVERDVAQSWVRYNGSAHITFLVFGDEDSEPLLGAYTLEGFRLGVDPVNQRLVSVHGFAK